VDDLNAKIARGEGLDDTDARLRRSLAINDNNNNSNNDDRGGRGRGRGRGGRGGRGRGGHARGGSRFHNNGNNNDINTNGGTINNTNNNTDGATNSVSSVPSATTTTGGGGILTPSAAVAVLGAGRTAPLPPLTSSIPPRVRKPKMVSSGSKASGALGALNMYDSDSNSDDDVDEEAQYAQQQQLLQPSSVLAPTESVSTIAEPSSSLTQPSTAVTTTATLTDPIMKTNNISSNPTDVNINANASNNTNSPDRRVTLNERRAQRDCKFWVGQGRCTRGDSCGYRHDPSVFLTLLIHCHYYCSYLTLCMLASYKASEASWWRRWQERER
jgi:hypothetical protein